MIERLEIRNIQAHRETILDLHSGVNVFVGISHQGKSAILRALRLLLYNQPIGTSYVRREKGEERYPVEVMAFLGKEIVARVRKKAVNEYRCVLRADIIGSKAGVFKALRGKVPPEISSLIPVGGLNYRSQLQGHFMVLDSPVEVAKILGRYMDADLLERLVKAVKKKLWHTKDEAKLASSLASQSKAVLSELKDVPDLVEELIGCEKLASEVEELTTFQARLSSLIWQTERVQVEIEAYAGLEGVEAANNELIKDVESLVDLEEDLDSLGGFIRELAAVEVLVDSTLTKELGALSAEFSETDKELKSLEVEEQQIERLGSLINQFNDAQVQVQRGDELLKRAVADQHKLELEYIDAVLESGICPTCGSKITAKNRSQIRDCLTDG